MSKIVVFFFLTPASRHQSRLFYIDIILETHAHGLYISFGDWANALEC